MSLTRLFSLALRIGLGSAWAAVLVVLGLGLLFGGLGLPPSGVRPPAGAAFISAGMFIFMVLVADRLVPSVGVRQSMWVVEMGTVAVLLGSAAVFCVMLVSGGGRA